MNEQEVKALMRQVETSLTTLRTERNRIRRAQHRAQAIEQIEMLRAELHLLQMALEQEETVAEVMRV